MSHAAPAAAPPVSYRIQGLSCADCAAQFERDVRGLSGVHDARLDFGSGRLAVWGPHERAAIQRLAALHDLTAVPADAFEEQAATKRKLSPRERWLAAALVALGAAWVWQTWGGTTALTGPLPGIVMPAPVALLLGAAIGAGGFSTFRKGIRALSRLRFDMNGLMTVAVAGALLIGEWWEAASVAVLYGIGEALENRTMERARQSVRSLLALTPRRATVRRDGREQEVEIDSVQAGDRVVVRPGQRIPVDGRVAAGHSAVDQSPITGESIPVDKEPGDPVFAGSINHHGLLEVVAERRAADSTLGRIIHLVEEAQGSRAPMQKFVDRFAARYTPAVLMAALLVVLLPPLALGEPWSPWIYRALALLVVACPCALVVSTPVALVSAIGAAARRGVLIKGGAPLERLASIRAVAFDKTGTLTVGHPRVMEVWARDGFTEEDVLAWAATLESASEHPLARAVVARARHLGLPSGFVSDFVALPGVGVRGRVGKETFWLGNRRLWDLEHPPGRAGLDETEPVLKDWEERGWAVMVLASRDGVVGAVALADPLRPEVPGALAALRRLGVGKTVLLSGDHPRAVAAVARQAGIDEYQGALLPEDKLRLIREGNETYGPVAMVGDGINDGPALASAAVGIAMGAAGSDTALETADVVLMNDDLGRVPEAIELSRRALGVIRQNIAFSLAVKALALLLIVPGWLTLWLAILADMGATIVVSLNGARLLWQR